jgi:predicted acylesterase/phospholipase RssA
LIVAAALLGIVAGLVAGAICCAIYCVAIERTMSRAADRLDEDHR